MIVMGINTCGTYKKAVKWLREHQIDFQPINLRETAPTKEELKTYHELSGLDIKKFFNTSGGSYKNGGFKDKIKTMSLDELYQALADDPMLIKRPLIVDGDYVRTGFHEEEYEQKWG